MKTSDSINELITALVAAQSEIELAPKDSANSHFKSSYADLSSVWGACRQALTKHHIAVIQSPSFVEGRVVLATRVIHKSGQWIENELSIKPMQDTAQGIGSCITYARRYALAAMVGVVADEDDDGNAAIKKQDKPKIEEKIQKTGKIFSNSNIQLKTWLEDFLLKNIVAKENWPYIFETLEGKDLSSELKPLMIRIKAKEGI